MVIFYFHNNIINTILNNIIMEIIDKILGVRNIKGIWSNYNNIIIDNISDIIK